MNSRRNLIASLVYQMATLLSGLITSRLIIGTFGSEVNGLVSSIVQLLSFILLFEGGVGAVVLTELYKPIEEKDNHRICQVLSECQKFFIKLAIGTIIYAVILSIIYPIYIADGFNFAYTCSLILILSISIVVQYLFSITNKLLLQAQQKIYVIYYVSTFTIILNLILTVVIIYFIPEIHIVKIVSSVVFLLQPFIFNKFVNKKYMLKKYQKKSKEKVLKNKWSGLGQNVAHFVTMNTDIAIVTLMIGLIDVSVYSVYMLAINALLSIISSAEYSFQSSLGKYYSLNNKELLKSKFAEFEKVSWMVSLVLFSTCMLLINQFVQLYTNGIEDAQYYRPIFAMIMVLASMIYCMREPYRLLALATGKFKETNWGAVIEAIINITISVLLVKKMGLSGLAIGTLIAIVYRLVYFWCYFRSDILCVPFNKYLNQVMRAAIIIIINIYIYYHVNIHIESILSFIVYGLIIVVFETILVICIFVGVSNFRDMVMGLFHNDEKFRGEV